MFQPTAFTRVGVGLLGVLTLCVGSAVCHDGIAAERHWEARALFSAATTDNVQLDGDGSAVVLQRGVLIEDDGPAAGYSYRPNAERLAEGVRVRKMLVVDDPRTERATLLVGGKGTFAFVVNGTPRELTAAGKAGFHWQAYSVPPDLLRKGENEVVIHGTGTIGIARADEFAAGSLTRTEHPNRSARSADGGRTWDDARLGTKGDVDGEYNVRLFLDRHRGEGTLRLPVVDVGNLAGRTVGPPLASVGAIRLSVAADGPGSAGLRVRTGNSPVPASQGWSDWQDVKSGGDVVSPSGRYLQVAVTLRTDDPLASPRLREVVVEADPVLADDWTTALALRESDNDPIVRTSIPFEYEPFDEPRLRKFREAYRLDDVTRGAASEFELIGRLAAWSAARWKPIGHLGEAYPPWDALEILREHSDGTPVGGFCQQFNLVFLQACESYGLVGRAVSLGPTAATPGLRSGHEVVEIWSNEHRKWVYVDGNHAWYFVDREQGVPLSLAELRLRQLAAFREEPHRPVRLVRIADTGREWERLTDSPPFAELRLIPRSNFLERAAPLPLNQGMHGWFWTGHHVWTDDVEPPALLYGHRVVDPHNWEWTLNQAHVVLEPTATPDEMRVHLDTETPGFETFLASIDGTEAKPVESGFLWRLHAGENELTVRPRNDAGREGIASRIVLERSK